MNLHKMLELKFESEKMHPLNLFILIDKPNAHKIFHFHILALTR
jgi:hypothetical protein